MKNHTGTLLVLVTLALALCTTTPVMSEEAPVKNCV